MAAEGIYISANDAVLDNLIALLNSLDVNADRPRPISVIPYDDEMGLTRREVAKHGNVTIFDDVDAMVRWEAFATAAWSSHRDALQTWERKYGVPGVHRMGMHRRFCAFDGPFEKFIYLDADMLVLDSLAPFFERLDHDEFVVYDDQHRAPSHVFELSSSRLPELFPESRIRAELFCAGFFASRRGLFDESRRRKVLAGLRSGDADVLYLWAPDQSLLNYSLMKTGVSVYNFFHRLDESQRVDTCVSRPDFEIRDGLVFDHGKRLPFLHYIGVPGWAVAAVCRGRNVAFAYRDLFLRYRYLRELESRPVLRGRPEPFYRPPGRLARLWKRVRARLRSAS